LQDLSVSVAIARKIIDNVSTVIVGKDSIVEQALAALIAEGHIIIEDVPGVGKTMLAKSLAASIGCSFRRIQFTPDLLPSDVTGVSIYNQNKAEFEFRQGPLMAQLVLADEINRATPKTQSALLEAMEENQITVDGVTHPLERPFLVMATQNPIEYEGTFPLPEAQLDRFLLRISLGYPDVNQELAIIEQQELEHPILDLKPVVQPQDIINLQNSAKSIYVDGLIRQYIVNITSLTRNREQIALGASPRASLGLFRASRSLALLKGRDYVIPDDVKNLVAPVLAHRLILSPAARMTGISTFQILSDLLEFIPVPI